MRGLRENYLNARSFSPSDIDGILVDGVFGRALAVCACGNRPSSRSTWKFQLPLLSQWQMVRRPRRPGASQEEVRIPSKEETAGERRRLHNRRWHGKQPIRPAVPGSMWQRRSRSKCGLASGRIAAASVGPFVEYTNKMTCTGRAYQWTLDYVVADK